MKLTNSRIEIGVLTMPKGSSEETGSVRLIKLDVIHNGTDVDLRSAVEKFIETDPPEVNEFMFAVFCMASCMQKKDGGIFICLGYEDAEGWMDELN